MSTALLHANSEQRSAAPSRDGRGCRVLRIVLGLLLVTAAGLKLYGLNVTAPPRVGWFATPQVQVAAAEWELVLGLWLLSGTAQHRAWLASVGTFSLFAIVSVYFGWIGVASCGCFGPIQARPWTAFAIDTVALVALSLFRPPSSVYRETPRTHAPALAITVGAMILALAAGAMSPRGSAAGQNGNLRWRSDVGLKIAPLTRPVNRMSAGSEQMIEIVLHNETDEVIQVDPVVTSCDCFHFDLPLSEIEPRKSVRGTAIVDFSQKPEFRGPITLIAESYLRGNSIILAYELRIEIDIE